VKIDLTNPNLWSAKYLPAITNPKYYNILYGGAGSGKSQQMIQNFLMEIMDPANVNQTFFVVRKVHSTLRNSVIQDFKNKIADWEIGGFVKVKISLFEITCSTNRIVFMGCDDPEKLKSLSQAKAIWIEEATELSLEDFTQITLRLRGKSIHKKNIYITFNPVADSHWLKNRFFDNPPEKERDSILILKATYRDNLSKLNPEYIDTLESLAEVNETMFSIYAEGEWGVWDKENLFARDFNELIHAVDGGWKAVKSLPLYCSFDFNTGNNTLMVAQHILNPSTHRYWADINILRTYVGADLETLCQTVLIDYPNMEIYVNGDSAGHSGNALTGDNVSAYQLITNYFRLNPEYQLVVPPGNIRHTSSQLYVNSVLKKCRIRIFRNQHLVKDGNVELISDLKSAKMVKNSLDEWKKKNPTMGHRLDAFRYYISSNFYSLVTDLNISKFNQKITVAEFD